MTILPCYMGTIYFIIHCKDLEKSHCLFISINLETSKISLPQLPYEKKTVLSNVFQLGFNGSCHPRVVFRSNCLRLNLVGCYRSQTWAIATDAGWDHLFVDAFPELEKGQFSIPLAYALPFALIASRMISSSGLHGRSCTLWNTWPWTKPCFGATRNTTNATSTRTWLAEQSLYSSTCPSQQCTGWEPTGHYATLAMFEVDFQAMPGPEENPCIRRLAFKANVSHL